MQVNNLIALETSGLATMKNRARWPEKLVTVWDNYL